MAIALVLRREPLVLKPGPLYGEIHDDLKFGTNEAETRTWEQHVRALMLAMVFKIQCTAATKLREYATAIRDNSRLPPGPLVGQSLMNQGVPMMAQVESQRLAHDAN